MPSAGLSLVGFMDQPDAVRHLSLACVPANPDPAALLAEWNVARNNLGPPTQNAGQPDIRPLPHECEVHLHQLQALPWVQAFLAQVPGATFQLVEIDPLLAYQFVVDTGRSAQHYQALRNPPSPGDIAPICLPLDQASGEYHYVATAHSVVIKSRSLNLHMTGHGIGPDIAGINFNWSIPLLHVVRLNGRCYLHNGFHRAYGLRVAGATHAPCLLRDVADEAAAGIRADGSTFGAALLASNDPPTLAHFTQGRAHPVRLRATTRIIHLSWAEYTMADE